MNILQELTLLQSMTVNQLREYYASIFRETTTTRHKHYLIRRILWGLQKQLSGGLSSQAIQRAQDLADVLYVRVLPQKQKAISGSIYKTQSKLSPGNILVRKYKAENICVLICENGFEYQGKLYKSLTAITSQITGSHWSGNKFFNINQPRGYVSCQK